MTWAEDSFVPLRHDLLLTDDEQDAIDGDMSTFQKLCAKHWNTATPARPTPRELTQTRDNHNPVVE
jgi:hypothetical protein